MQNNVYLIISLFPVALEFLIMHSLSYRIHDAFRRIDYDITRIEILQYERIRVSFWPSDGPFFLHIIL